MHSIKCIFIDTEFTVIVHFSCSDEHLRSGNTDKFIINFMNYERALIVTHSTTSIHSNMHGTLTNGKR